MNRIIRPVLLLSFIVAAVAAFALSRPISTRSLEPPGRWHQARPIDRADGSASDHSDDDGNEASARLGALPYLAGTHPAPSQSGVVVHDRKLAWEGLNFVVSADAPAASLIDMEGTVLHRWSLSPERLWPEYDTAPMRRRARYWRRARLMEDADVIALYEGAGIARLDPLSQPLWSRSGEFHHDFDIDDAGNLHVLERRQTGPPAIPRGFPLLLDYIVTLDRTGSPIREISIEECFERSGYSGLLDGLAREGDIFHTNTISWLDGALAGRSSIFRKDNLLISQRNTDILAIIDPSERKVVWAGRSSWRQQHDPNLLDSGWILLFDNSGLGDRSRIIETDPLTGGTKLVYAGDEKNPFFSATCGASQRLGNGNTLVTESDFGRAFEVTPDGKIVWEYLNPHRAGARDELIATLFEVTRIPRGRFPLRVLD